MRLFVALELPEGVRTALARWAADAVRAAAGGPGSVRVLAPESLHVTLCFLGARPVGEIEAIAAAVRETLEPAPRLSLELGTPVWLPSRRPRVGACSLIDVSGALGALQARVSQRLASGGWYAPERRPFLAHVTVARLGRDGPRRPPALEGLVIAGFVAQAVTLYRSHVGSAGASYEPLASVGLAG